MAQSARILIALNKHYSASDVKTQGVVIPYLKGHDNHIEATHEVALSWVYYGHHYQRGNWLRIGSELMALLKCHAVDAVWYFGDYCDNEGAQRPISIDFVLGLYEHYANN